MFYMDRLNTQKNEMLNLEVIPPLSESLLSAESKSSLLEDSVLSNPDFQKEASLRKDLIKNLDIFYKKIPNPTKPIEELADKGELSEDEIKNIYTSFSELLNNKENSRLILYYPFELIPSKKWISESKELNKIVLEFQNKYIATWQEQIPIHDYRTNFLDGDILEPEIQTYSGQPEVSKASHLIPVLVEKGLIDFNKVFELAENTNDLVVKHSILDTWPTLQDMNLISGEDMNKIKNSKDSLIRNMSIILENTENEQEKEPESLQEISMNIKSEISAQENIEVNKNKTKDRINWEHKRNLEKILNKNSLQLFQLIEKNKISIQELKTFTLENDSNRIVAIGGITKFILNTENKGQIEEYTPFLKELSKDASAEVLEVLNDAWAKLEHKNIDNNYSRNILPEENKRRNAEMQEMKNYANLIENNEELKKYLYPAVLMYGSKIKGYGGINSDTDIALFIKPNTDINDKTIIDLKVSELFKTKDVPIKFWLKQVEDHLEVINMPDGEKTGWSYMANILLNGAWCGEKNSIKELHNKLIAEYFYLNDKKINGVKLRDVMLRQLERDTLQYRLMHKGYAKYHAPQGGINTPNSKDIDGESMFWDSGYRRLATRLFIEKVFIPNLKK